MIDVIVTYVLLAMPLAPSTERMRLVEETPSLMQCSQRLAEESKRNPTAGYTCQAFVKPLRKAMAV